MIEDIADQLQDMVIGQRIVNMFGFPPACHQTGRMQELEPRRNRRELIALGLGEFADAALALGKAQQQPQPGRIASSAEHCCRALKGLFGRRSKWLAFWVRTVRTCRIVACLRHYHPNNQTIN